MGGVRSIIEAGRAIRPLWLMVTAVVISLLVEEAYPFSHFPMYSRFHERTWYVYVSDAEGRPLPTRETFGLSTPQLKKRLRAELAAASDPNVSPQALEESAGRALLEVLAARSRRPGLPLALWRVEIRRMGDGIARESHRVAALE